MKDSTERTGKMKERKIELLGLIGLILCVSAMIVYMWTTTADVNKISKRLDNLEAKLEQVSSGINTLTETTKELESIKADINTLKDNGKTYTEQIEGVSDSITKLQKELKDKVEDLNKKIKAVEEAKAEKKALEVEMLAAAVSDPGYVETSYTAPTGGCLTPSGGVYNGPSGLETYYNLPMDGVIEQARNFGIEGEYWVRDDGVKMYGDYVICACNRDIYPLGSLVETSFGTGISLDTGAFVAWNPTNVDIATSW